MALGGSLVACFEKSLYVVVMDKIVKLFNSKRLAADSQQVAVIAALEHGLDCLTDNSHIQGVVIRIKRRNPAVVTGTSQEITSVKVNCLKVKVGLFLF